ncbi:hypothetical protein HG534_10380 [Moraxella osloensis]|nr:WG repeat-containing protein [Moraxella osloensis]MBW4016699.1 hypothetical protein [Moraxella osloensis]
MTAIYAPSSKLDTLIYLLDFVPPSLDIFGQMRKLLPSLAILDNAHYAEHYEKIQQISQRLEEEITDSQIADTLTVGFGGGFSAGKSRFINSLLGIEVLPEALEPCTAVATYLSQGDEEHFIAQNVFHKKLPVNAEQISTLKHFVGADDNQNLQISEIVRQIHFTTPKMLWENLTFLDTPGYSKADNSEHKNSDEQIALTQLKNVDHIVWLVSAKNGMMREDDFAFLEEVQPKNPIFIVLTQADLANSLSDVKQVMKAIKTHLTRKGIDYAGIMAWSAPLNQKIGSKVAGDDIQKWLKIINQPQHNVGFQLLEDYIQELKQLVNNFTLSLSLDEQTKSLYKKIQLQPVDNMPLLNKVAQTFNFLLEDLTTQVYVNIGEYYTQTNDLLSASDYFFKTSYLHTSMRWLEEMAYSHDDIADRLIEYYQATNAPNKKIFDIYIRLIKNNYPKSIDNLISFAEKITDETTLSDIANFFEHYQQDLIIATDIHIKISSHGKNFASTQWLLKKAVNNQYTLKALHQLVEEARLDTLYFDYANLLLHLKNDNEALNFIYLSAQMDYKKAIDWLFDDKINKQAQIILKKLIDSKVQSDLYYRYALLMQRQQQKDLTLQYLLKAAALDHLQAIEQLVNLSDRDEKVYTQFKYITENASSAILYYQLALIEESKHNSSKAISYLLKAFALGNPESEEIIENYANESHIVSFRFAEIYESIRHDLEKAVKYFIQSARIAINSANCQIFQPAFEKLFHYALQKHDISATHTLIDFYQTKIEDFNKLSELHIENAKIHDNADSLFWLVNRAEQHSSIQDALLQLVDFEKSEKTTYQYLDILYRFGNSDEAIEKSINFVKNDKNKDELALQWLKVKADKDHRISLALADIYLYIASKQNISKSTNYYVKAAQLGSEKAVDGMLEFIKSYKNEPAIQQFIDVYCTCDQNIQRQLIKLYEVFLDLNVLYCEEQRNTIYKYFHNEVLKGNYDLSSFEDISTTNNNLFYKLLLADIYIKSNASKDNYRKAFLIYKSISSISYDAEYNRFVLGYYLFDQETIKIRSTNKLIIYITNSINLLIYLIILIPYFIVLILKKNNPLFNISRRYFWSQVIGYRKPLPVDPLNQEVNFTIHPRKKFINRLIIISIFSALIIIAALSSLNFLKKITNDYECIKPKNKNIDEVHISCPTEGLAGFISEDDKVGFLDENGDIIISPVYDITNPHSMALPKFKEGAAAVRLSNGNESKWGFIDKQGQLIIPYQYDYASDFSEGLASVLKDNKVGFIDKANRLIIPYNFSYDVDTYDDNIFTSSFSEGLAAVKKISDGKYGYINKQGKLVIPYEFEVASDFSEGLAAVKEINDGKYGYINKQGKLVIPYEFEMAYDFSEDLAYVIKNGQGFFIDQKGNIVIPLKDGEYAPWNKFKNGIAEIQIKEYSFKIDKHGNKVNWFENILRKLWLFINKESA